MITSSLGFAEELVVGSGNAGKPCQIKQAYGMFAEGFYNAIGVCTKVGGPTAAPQSDSESMFSQTTYYSDNTVQANPVSSPNLRRVDTRRSTALRRNVVSPAPAASTVVNSGIRTFAPGAMDRMASQTQDTTAQVEPLPAAQPTATDWLAANKGYVAVGIGAIIVAALVL